MEKKARAVLLATAALLTVMLLWKWGSRPPKAVEVRTGKAAVQNIYNGVNVPGTVEAAQRSSVSPRKSGTAAVVCVAVGDEVKAGDVLVTLSDEAPRAVDAAALQTAWNALTGPSVKTETAVQDAVLRAPQAGTVLSVPEPGDTVWAGLPCASVADLTRLCVYAQTPEIYADTIRKGQLVNVVTNAVEEQIYAGVVESVAPEAVRAVSLTGDSGAAAVETRIRLKGSTRGLRPGSSVTAKIFNDFRENAVVVPFEAVCQRGEQEYVFSVENGRVSLHAVTTGYLLETVTEVREGLNGQETVVLNPPDSLRDGDAVEVLA